MNATLGPDKAACFPRGVSIADAISVLEFDLFQISSSLSVETVDDIAAFKQRLRCSPFSWPRICRRYSDEAQQATSHLSQQHEPASEASEAV